MARENRKMAQIEHAGRARMARIRARIERAEWDEELSEALSLGPVNVKSASIGEAHGG